MQYLVKRQGLDFSACGLVDVIAAKRQRLENLPNESNADITCPVSISLVEDWEAFERSFKCAVHAHSDSGELDMGK